MSTQSKLAVDELIRQANLKAKAKLEADDARKAKLREATRVKQSKAAGEGEMEP